MKPIGPMLVLFALVTAGCTAPEAGDRPDRRGVDPLQSISDAFGYTVHSPEGPVAGLAWTVTGTVEQPTHVAALQGPVHDFVGEQQLVNGTWSIDVALEPGVQEIWVDLQAAEADGHAFVIVPVTVLAQATIQIDYGSNSDRDPVEDTVWVNVVDYDSQSMYDAEGATHPDYANVHDVLVAWEEQTGHDVTYSYSERFSSFGVDKIDGEGNPVTTQAPPWWCYEVNGESEGVQGITLQRFQPGDVIHWVLGTCQAGLM